MANFNIRGIDDELAKKAKMEALSRGLSLRQFVIWLLRKAVEKRGGK
jgi:predicted HicB family RNase H-like nuclease